MLDADDDDQGAAEAQPQKNPDDESLLRKLKRWERLAKNHWSKWREEARLSYDFVAGKQWSADDKTALLNQMRQPVTFNRIAPMVDAVTGAEILNRQEVRYLPREQGDVQVNELITAADEWARELSDTEDEESDAFADVVTCGLGWTETRMDYAEDAEGRIIDDRIDPLEMWVDGSQPLKRCCGNAQYLIRARYRNKADLPAKWRKKMDDATTGPGNIDEMEQGHTGPRDDYEREDDHSKSPAEADKKQVWVRHFQWFEKEEAYRIADPMTGTVAVIDKKKLRQIAQMFLQNGMRPPQAVKIEQNKYYQAIVIGNSIVETGPIEGNSFTFKCITGKRDRNTNTFYGVVRAMIDPQMWGNKFFVQIMHILNTAAKGGLMYESDSFVNPRKALEDWAKPDAAIELSKGALSNAGGERIKERLPAVFPAGTEKMMEFALNNLPQTSGINLELLGLVEREQPGILEMQRKKAGYAILAVFFDSLRRYRKMKGRLRLFFIQNYISDGRLIRIKGKDSTLQYVPLVRQEGTAEYDVIVDEAAMSPNQKEATWAMMQAMMPMLAKLNVPPEVWSVMLEYSPLPSSVSGKINEIISKQAEQPPPPDPDMLKIQVQLEADKAKMMLEGQQAQLEAQMEQQSQQQELQFKREMHEFDKEAKILDLQVQREKAQIDIQKTVAGLEVQERKDSLALQTQAAKDEQAVAAAKSKAAAQPKPKKKVAA